MKITSPGQSVMTADSDAVQLGTPKIRSLVRECCMRSSSTSHHSSMSSGSSRESTDTTAGPIGPNVSKLLPSENCGGEPISWTVVADVLAERHTRHMRPCPVGLDPAATDADHHHQLNLPVDAVAGQLDVVAVAREAVRQLGERDR